MLICVKGKKVCVSCRVQGLKGTNIFLAGTVICKQMRCDRNGDRVPNNGIDGSRPARSACFSHKHQQMIISSIIFDSFDFMNHLPFLRIQTDTVPICTRSGWLKWKWNHREKVRYKKTHANNSGRQKKRKKRPVKSLEIVCDVLDKSERSLIKIKLMTSYRNNLRKCLFRVVVVWRIYYDQFIIWERHQKLRAK